jgi:hypothetical protein
MRGCVHGTRGDCRYNTDVAMVGPPMSARASKAHDVSGLPPHQWAMIFECVVVARDFLLDVVC